MRLKNFLLSALLACALAFIDVSCANAQEDDFFFTEFVRDEATYQSQELVIPRSSTQNPVTLRKQLSFVVGDLNYTGVKVIQSYTGGMEVYEYEDVSKVLDVDPVYLSYDKIKDDEMSCPGEVQAVVETKKDIWWQMIQLLPSSYNQKRTVMLNYEVLANIYKSRKNHKLDEWQEFCKWIESLPYSELITN